MLSQQDMRNILRHRCEKQITLLDSVTVTAYLAL